MAGLILNDTEDINVTGGNIVLNEPAGLAVGDLLLASLLNSAASATAVPANITGFTSDTTNSSATGSGRTTHRVADGTEGPTYTSTVGASTAYTIGKLLRILNIDTTTPIDGVSAVASGTAASFALPAVTTSQAGCLAVALVGTASPNNTAVPAGWFLYDRYDTDGSAIYFRWMGAAGQSTGTSTVTLAASALYIGTVLTLAPDTVPWATVAGLVSEIGTSLGSANAQPTFAAPGRAQASGDLVIHVVGLDANAVATDISASTGWTVLDHTTQGSNVIKGCLVARVLDGGANDTLSVTGSTNDYCTGGIIIPAGEHGVTNVSTDILRATPTTGASGNADPPSLDTGTVDDYLVIAAAVVDATTGNTITAYPTGYAPLLALVSASSTSSVMLGMAALNSNGQVFNPGTFTNPTQEWIGFTFAVPPAATDAAATPPVVAAIVAVPAPTITAGTNVNATPGVVAAIVAVLAPTITVAASAAATPTAVTVSVTVPAPQIRIGNYPTAVSANGRWIEDQHGNPWPVLGDANIVIHTVPHLTVDEVATGKSVESYLDELVAHGFNAFWCKFVYAAFSGLIYEDVDGNEPFVGTIFQTALNDAYWDNWEIIFQMAAARGISIFVFPTWAGFDDSEGDRVAMEAASGVQMQAYGSAIGARFAAYPNLIWMNTGDRPSPSATTVARWKSVQDGVIAGGATQLWGMQGTRGVPQTTYISTNSMGAHVLDLNTMYQDAADPTGDAAAGWGENIGPTVTYEFQYRNDPTAPTLDRLRLQTWGTFCAGSNGQVMGNNPRWHMDTVAAYAVPGTTYLETWSSAGDEDRDTDDFSVFANFVTTISDRLDTLVPDTTDTFLTSGEGTGVTRSSARFDDTATTGVLAVVFRAHGGSATLTLDLTEFTAHTTVRIRKLDPVSGVYTTVGTFNTSSAQSVGSLGNNSAGDNDWVLVVESSPDAVATPAAVTTTVAVPAPTVRTGVGATPAVVTATVAVLAPTTTTGASATPAAVTATTAVNTPSVSAGGSATTTPTAVNTTVVVPAPTVTASSSATATPAVVTATVAVLAPVVSVSGGVTVSAALISLTVQILTPSLIGAGLIGGTGVGSVVWRDRVTAGIRAVNRGTGEVTQP